MASAEKYAAWIVANADKRGTPEFDTVARAYQEAKSLPTAPVPTRQTKQTAVQQQMLKKSEEDQGSIGRFVDSLFGIKNTAPKALTETEQSTRVKDIAAERQKILNTAARLEAQYKAGLKDAFASTPEDRQQNELLKNSAKQYRARAAALGRQAAFITKTGVEAPKPSFARETLGAAPREFTRGITSLPGVLEEFTGRGLSMVGASDTGKYLTKTGQADQEAARKFAEGIFGAPSEALQFDASTQLAADVSSGAGSMATFAVPGGAARLAGVGKGLQGAEKAAAIAKAARAGQYGIATTQGAGQGAEDIRAYEQRTGEKVSDATAFVTMLLNAGLGAAEVGVFNKLVERIPVAQRGAAMERVAETVRRLSGGRVDPTAIATAVGRELTAIEANATGRIAVRGGAEAAQEGGVQLGSNVIAKGLYDEDRDVTEGVGRAALVGSIVGGGVRGGVEITNALGKRAADNRQKAFEQIAAATAPIEEFDINVGSYEDPSQLTRQKVQRISEPDANGDVFARRADGTVYQTSLKELYRMRAPTGGIRAVPIPDTLSAPALTQRLTGALGNAEPDSDMQSYINSVTTTLNNNMALGTPEKTETYLQKQQNGLRRARLSEDAKIARMLVLDEAVRLNNEYVGLVTAPPEGTDPNVNQAVINEPPAPLSDEEIQSQIDTMRAMREQRVEALNVIASDPNYIDKVETFEALMVQNGFDAPSTVEVAALYDAMRAESDAETAAGQEKDTTERQQLVDRINIIESVLYDDRIPTGREEEILAAQEAIDAQIAAERAKLAAQPNKNIPAARRAIKNIEALEARRAVVGKAENIDAKLRKKGYKPLYRHEIERIGGFEAANAVFGPEGEYTQRRQALFDQVVADPTITDKYRGYAEALDQFPELGDPTVDEIRILRGDAAPLETQIAESAEPITTAQLSAEPGGLTEEGITSGQLEGEVLRDKPKRNADARAAINELIAVEQAKLDEAQRATIGESADQVAINERIAVEQAKLDAEPNKSTPAARRAINAIKALTEPYKSTPAARRAIANIKALEAERDALGEAPVVEEVVQEPVQDEALVEEVAPAPTATPQEILADIDDAAISEAQARDFDQDAFLEGVADVRNGGEPLSLPDALRAYGSSGKFQIDDPNTVVANSRVEGAKWAQGRVAEAQAAAPTAASTPEAVTEQPAPTAAKQTINNPEEDVSPVEEQLEADPTTIEGAFPASLNRPRAEAIGFAADLERRVKSIRSRLRRRLEGKYKTAYDYSRALSAAYGVTKLPADLDVARKFELLESRKIGGQMQLNRWYLQPIEDKMIKLGVDPDDAAMYFWARSAPGRNALVLERSEGKITDGSGMSDAQAQAKLDQLEIEGLGPKLREIAKLHDALVDYMGNQRVKAGLLSKEAWRAMRKAQPFYTPLKGYALDGDMQVDGEPNPHSDAERGIAKRNGTRVREVLTTRGRKSIPFNPLYNLMSDAQFAIARIEQNKVKQTFLNNILSDPESHKDLVTVYTPKKKTHPGGHVTKPKIGPIGKGETGPVDMNQLAAQPDAKLMIVKKDGEPYYIEFTETPAANALYRLFGNMTPKQVNQFFRGIDFQVDGKSYHIPGTIEVANTLKSFKTRFSPVFTLLVAPIRDIKEAITTAYIAQGIKGGPAEGTKLGKRTARYIASLDGIGTISNYLRGNDPTTAEGQINALLFDQFLEDGGAVGHALVMESERYAQNVAKNIKRYAALKRGNPGAAALKAKDMLAGALDHVSQLLDLHMRFATYRAALEQNISREDAAALALDSTLDMTRRGELGPQLDSWAFFFSPTIGGARKLLSQGRYSAIARKLFTKLIGTGMLIYLFNRFGPGAGDDDEDGRPNILEVNNATAQTRVILRGGPGINDYVSVPTAFGIGFFNYLGGQIMATILGDIQPTEAATNIVGGLISLASPIKTEGTEGLTGIVNFAVPDTGQFISDLIFNRSAFGSPIYTEQEYSTLPKSELGREETGEVWKFVARGINSLFGGTRTVESVGSVQPEQYRYIAQQLLGGAYTFSRDIVDAVSGEAKPEQTTLQRIPLIKTFVGKGGEYAPMNKFYEDYDTLRSIHSTYIKSGEDPEAWAENKAAYPVQTDSRVMDAFDTALSAIRAINDAARGGAYDTSQEKYAALNDVYKEFNKTYSEVKKAK